MTSNFDHDVNNPVNRKAEQLAFHTLREFYAGIGGTIDDVSGEFLKWDFVVRHGGRVERVDVKCDSYYETTRRIPFEMYHRFSDGRPSDPAWGINDNLNHIALVPTSLSQVVLIPLSPLRAYVAYALDYHGKDAVVQRQGWRRIERANVGRGGAWTTYGWAIPQSEFEKYLAHFGLGEIPVLPIQREAA